MASFYFPFNLTLNNIPIIIYPCIGVEKIFNRKENKIIDSHLNALYEKNKESLSIGNYHIVILWENEGAIMSDVWIFDKLESWQSGPLVDVRIFKNLDLETGMGVSAGDGLVMLGAEELQRRKAKSFDDYINGSRAELPEGIKAEEKFYN